MDQHARAWTRRPVDGWVLGLTVLIAAPVLAPGYVLSYDQVAVPRQSLLPDSFGVGEGLPRAVPADAVTALLTHVVAGQWIQKLLLLGVLLLAGCGAARLVPTRRRLVMAVAATVYVWNPYVAERLVLGHWWLLLGYACLPWLVPATLAAVRGGLPEAGRLVLWLALASLVPTAGVLACLVVSVTAIGASFAQGLRCSMAALVRVGAALVVAQVPWVLPGVLHPSAAWPASSVDLFAARAEGSLGVLGSVVTLGGVWNAAAEPASRESFVALVGLVLVAFALAVGWPLLRDRMPDNCGWSLTLLGLLGVGLAVWTSTKWGARALGELNGWGAAGLLRDSQKFVALWALPLCLLVALAVERVLARLSDPAARTAALGAAVLLPLVVMPDLAWGVGGRLHAVALPTGWDHVRQLIADSAEPGDVVVLPWSAFRRFGFNDGRTSLDPAPRWLPVPSVVDTRLVVEVEGGPLVLPAEGSRSAQVTEILQSREPNAPDELGQLGIGWVVIEKDTPGAVPSSLASAGEQRYDDEAVQLRRITPTAPAPGWGRGSLLVLGADVLVGAILLLSGVLVLLRRPARA